MKKASKKIAGLVLIAIFLTANIFSVSAASRYQLKGYTENQEWGAFVLHPCIDIKVEGNSFEISNNNYRANGEPNIVWWIPGDQLEKTPYLIVDVANKGTEDIGPGMHIWAYWLNRSGQKYFVRSMKANNMSGVSCFNLKEEMDKLGADTNGLNLNIATVYDPNDSTSLDPLQFNEVYLSSEPLESTATTKAPTTEAPKTTAALPQTTASVSSDPDVSSTTSETTQTTTTTSAVGTQETAGNSTKPSDVREEKPQKSKWLYWILGVAGLVLLAGAGTAVWYWQRKKKRNG